VVLSSKNLFVILFVDPRSLAILRNLYGTYVARLASAAG
jgi:hypothetical protein